MCASRKGFFCRRDPCGRNESEGGHWALQEVRRWDCMSSAASTDLDMRAIALKDLSKSACVGTRKMVNYA